MHDYYIVKTCDDGTRCFYNHVDKGWDKGSNDSLFTLKECTRLVPRIQQETVFPVTCMHFREVK